MSRDEERRFMQALRSVHWGRSVRRVDVEFFSDVADVVVIITDTAPFAPTWPETRTRIRRDLRSALRVFDVDPSFASVSFLTRDENDEVRRAEADA